jgi:aldose 1-epimerase
MNLRILSAMAAVPLSLSAANYSAQRVHIDGVDIIRLEDAAQHTVVSIAPSIGNIAYEMRVKGRNILWFPYESVGEFRKNPRMCGIPLLAPWADRLDETAFYANGKKYPFNLGLGNIRLDGSGHPIHGFLTLVSDWQVREVKADAAGAQVSSVLDVSRRPEWMAQFPFVHSIQITHKLQDGVLQVTTRIENHSAEAMPVSIGFHSFYQITDAPRSDWMVSLGAGLEWPVDKDLLPTGQTRPLSELVANPANFKLGDRAFDNVLAGFHRDSQGRAIFRLKGKAQEIEVSYGPRYLAGEIWAPPNREFLCFEPMAAIDNGINLAHRGIYKELQSLPAGQVWQESFWVRASGF